MVRTLRCGRSNPGSNPGHGMDNFFFFLKLKNLQKLRRPGIEPGSTAWKAAMLTIIPPTLTSKKSLMLMNLDNIVIAFEIYTAR